MTRPRASTYLVWLPCLICMSAASGGDATSSDERPVIFAESTFDSTGARLRWDNIEGAPLLVAGKLPEWNGSTTRHEWELETGDAILLHVGENAVVRVVANEVADLSRSFSFERSGPDGLFVPVPARALPGGESLLVATEVNVPQVLRIRVGGNEGRKTRFAVFLARIDRDSVASEYHRRVPLPGFDEVTLRRSRFHYGRAYSRVPAGRPIDVVVRGPVDLLFGSRLLYPHGTTRSIEGYRVRFVVDGVEEVKQIETTIDRSRVGSSATRRGHGYERYVSFRLDEGRHSLRIVSESSLLCRLLAWRADDFLLHPPLPPSPDAASGVQTVFDALAGEQHLSDLGMFDHADRWSERIERSPAIAVFDSVYARGHPDAGLVASWLLREEAKRLGAAPVDDRAANVMSNRHDRYVNLLPVAVPSGSSLRRRARVTHRFRDPYALAEDVFVRERDLIRFAPPVPFGTFAALPSNRDHELRFRLPERGAPSRLRLVVLRQHDDSERKIWLRLGNRGERELTLSSLPSELAERVVPADLEIARSVVWATTGRNDEYELLRHLSGRATPREIVPAASAVIDLPRGVEEIGLWADGGGEPIHVALDYLDSEPYRMTEREYLAALDALDDGSPAELFANSYRRWRRERAWISETRRRLVAQWSGVFRWLERGLEALERSAGSGASIEIRRPDALDAEYADELLERARRLTVEGRWVPALETWSELARVGDRRQRRAAHLERCRALWSVGEHYLFHLEVRRLFLRAEEPALRRAAFDLLAERCRESGEMIPAGIWAQNLIVDDTPGAAVRAVVIALAERGEWRSALAVGLLLEDWELPLETLLTAAVKARWWITMDRLLERLTDSEALEYWSGVRAAHRGEIDAARATLTRAGERGRAALARIDEALAIAQRLRSGSFAERAEAIFAWERWRESLPGPRTWVALDDCVIRYGFSDWVRESRAETRRQLVGAEDGGQVRMKILGPRTVRLRLRPLVDSDYRAGDRAWIDVRIDGELHPMPVTSSEVVASLSLMQRRRYRSLNRIEEEFDLGPGLHELVVEPRGVAVLVRTFEHRPALWEGLLARWSPAVVASVLRDRDRNTPRAMGPSYPARLELERDTITAARLPYRIPVYPIRASLAGTIRELPGGIDPALLARLALRLEARSLVGQRPPSVDDLPADSAIVDPRELDLASYRFLSGSRTHAGSTGRALIATLLERGDLTSITELSVPEDPETAVVYLRALLLAVESGHRAEKTAAAKALIALRSFPERREVAGIARRLSQRYHWRLVSSIVSRAGLRSIRTSPSESESPRTRVRQALAGPSPLGTSARQLGRREQFVHVIDRPRPSRWIVHVASESATSRAIRPVEVVCELDDWDRRTIDLSVDRPRAALSWIVPSGFHRLRLRVVDGAPNQFLSVAVEDIDGTVSEDDDAGGESPVASRIYQVSRNDRRLRVAVEGPTVVRVDELRDDEVHSEYHLVEEGWQELEIPPSEGRDRGLFRAFEYVPREERLEPPEILTPDVEPPPKAEPPWRIDDERQAGTVVAKDGVELSGQEDGTRSFAAVFRRRRASEEDGDERIIAEQFLELRAIHRWRSEWWRAYFETGALARVREEGGPVVGAWHRFERALDSLPLSAIASARVYAQAPDGDAVAPRGDVEWSLLGRASLEHRAPLGDLTDAILTASLLGRVLSLDSRRDFEPGDVDQDIFTPYKLDHRGGASLAARVVHRPWVDTRWWAGSGLLTNEDLNPVAPDRLWGEVGWAQLLFQWEIALAYRASFFPSDDDRRSSRSRHSLIAEVTQELWSRNATRWEMAFTFRHDLPDNRSTGFLAFVVHFGRGRGYRDFSEVRFRRLRRAAIPSEFTNRISEEQP